MPELRQNKPGDFSVKVVQGWGQAHLTGFSHPKRPSYPGAGHRCFPL